MRSSRRNACLLVLVAGLGVSCVGTAPIAESGTGGSTPTGMGSGGANSPERGTGGTAAGVGGGGVGGSGIGGAAQVDGGSGDIRLDAAAAAGGRGALDAGGEGGTTGAAGAGGVSLCTPGRYLVCEGFENTTVGTNVAPTGWTRTGAVDVIADAAGVYRGAHAMRINAAASGPRRINLAGGAAAALGGQHWGRIFYKVQLPAPKPASGVVHSTLVAGSATSPVSGTIEVRVVDTVEDTTGHHQFLYNVQPNGRNEFGKGSAYNWTYDGNWHCAEWHVDYATQSYHFYFDGTEVTQLAITNGAGRFTNSEIPMVFSSMSVGWNNYQMSTPGFVAWFDEIAMDVNRIGCGN